MDNKYLLVLLVTISYSVCQNPDELHPILEENPWYFFDPLRVSPVIGGTEGPHTLQRINTQQRINSPTNEKDKGRPQVRIEDKHEDHSSFFEYPLESDQNLSPLFEISTQRNQEFNGRFEEFHKIDGINTEYYDIDPEEKKQVDFYPIPIESQKFSDESNNKKNSKFFNNEKKEVKFFESSDREANIDVSENSLHQNQSDSIISELNDEELQRDDAHYNEPIIPSFRRIEDDDFDDNDSSHRERNFNVPENSLHRNRKFSKISELNDKDIATNFPENEHRDLYLLPELQRDGRNYNKPIIPVLRRIEEEDFENNEPRLVNKPENFQLIPGQNNAQDYILNTPNFVDGRFDGHILPLQEDLQNIQNTNYRRQNGNAKNYFTRKINDGSINKQSDTIPSVETDLDDKFNEEEERQQKQRLNIRFEQPYSVPIEETDLYERFDQVGKQQQQLNIRFEPKIRRIFKTNPSPKISFYRDSNDLSKEKNSLIGELDKNVDELPPKRLLKTKKNSLRLFKVHTKEVKAEDLMSDEKENRLLDQLQILRMKPEKGHLRNVVRKKMKSDSKAKQLLKGAGLRKMMIVVRKSGKELLRKKLWLHTGSHPNSLHRKSNKGYSIVLKKGDKKAKADILRSIKYAVKNRRKSDTKSNKRRLKKIKTFDIIN